MGDVQYQAHHAAQEHPGFGKCNQIADCHVIRVLSPLMLCADECHHRLPPSLTPYSLVLPALPSPQGAQVPPRSGQGKGGAQHTGDQVQEGGLTLVTCVVLWVG
jgi:hypothetical protein